MADRTEARSVDLALRVMDHQLVGPDGALLGNVDNLVLREDDGVLAVVGLLSGPGGFGPRQPGLLGGWIVAVWKRLSADEDPRPLMVPMSQVRSIGSAITLSDEAEDVLLGSQGLEQWLRRHVISAIPGAKEGDDRLAGRSVGPHTRHEELARPVGTHLLSDLLGAAVVTDTGAPAGTVMEVRADRSGTGPEVGPLRVTSIVFGRHRLGGGLGYTTLTDQGPWLLARGFGWWHRGDREVAWGQVRDVDWAGRRVTLTGGEGWPHPHDTTAGPR